MTFSLTKVLVTLLAIAQFSNNTPHIAASYDPNKPEVMAADLGRGCRALFTNDKFFTAGEIDKIAADLRQQLEAQGMTDESDEVPPPEPGSPPASLVADDLSTTDGDAEGDIDDSGDRSNGEGGVTGNSETFAQALAGMKLFKDLSFSQALDIWDGICRDKIDLAKVSFLNWQEIAGAYNESVATLPDYKFLKGYRLPETSFIYDMDGKFVSETYSREGRRTWIAGKDIPAHVKQAFISAEDQNFRTHKGIEPHGVLRGFMKFLKSKKVEGGSTITQQVIKNLVVGADVTLDRKIKEMLLAKLVENTLNKDEILELYLNLVNLGRASWGVETASQNYFGKSVKQLTVGEAAFVAGTTHSPNRYEPSLHMDKVKERQKFVVQRMLADKAITQVQADEALKTELVFLPRRSDVGGNYFLSAVTSHLRDKFGKDTVKRGGLKIRTTLHQGLQKLTEAALQEGLFQYELKTGRLRWWGPVASLPDMNPLNPDAWTKSLAYMKKSYSDISWEIAVILSTANGVKLGFADGSKADLMNKKTPRWVRDLVTDIYVGDVIFVKNEGDGNYSLRVPSTVQGSAVVMDPHTGRVLALAGGFSSTYSQHEEGGDDYNRAIHAHRQPGSTLKPFTYLTALQYGFQPNTLVPNAPTYFPKVKKDGTLICKSWNPKNYSGGGPTILTMRRGLETSNNRVTAQILKAMQPGDFMTALNAVRDTTKEFGIYDDPYFCASFILGADETTLMRMVHAYAQISNGGIKITPRLIDTLTDVQGNNIALNYPAPQPLQSVDATSIYQLRYILQGVIDRGTATRIKDLSGFVAGKTGTSNDENDAWFVGFTNDLVVGVWVGYDSRKTYPSLGREGTGGRTALPIFEKIIRGSFDIYRPAAPLSDPPANVYFATTNIATGDILNDNQTGKGVLLEAYRSGSDNTQNYIISQ